METVIKSDVQHILSGKLGLKFEACAAAGAYPKEDPTC